MSKFITIFRNSILTKDAIIIITIAVIMAIIIAIIMAIIIILLISINTFSWTNCARNREARERPHLVCVCLGDDKTV